MTKLLKQYFNAIKRYNPRDLSLHFIDSYGDVRVIDRGLYVKNESDEELFCTVLHNDYLWDYSTPLEQTSIYYSLSDEGIVGGAYDMITKRPISRTVIVPKPGIKFKYLTPIYTYDDKIYQELLQNFHFKD